MCSGFGVKHSCLWPLGQPLILLAVGPQGYGRTFSFICLSFDNYLLNPGYLLAAWDIPMSKLDLMPVLVTFSFFLLGEVTFWVKFLL